MLKVIPETEVAQTRPPLAFALAIDTSGSMREFADQEAAKGEVRSRGLQGQQQAADGANYQTYDLNLPSKLDRAIEAAHALIDDERLTPNDQLAVIHFDDEARSLLRLTTLGSKESAHAAVEKLRDYSGGTYMAEGMRLALQEVSDLPRQVAKRLLLLTDGRTFDEDECSSRAPQFAAANTPIIAIGIGAEYNDELMLEIAQVSQGRPYHLQDISQLRAILDAEVGSSSREVVTDLQATIATVKGVTLNSFTRVYPSLAEIDISSTRYQLGNIAAGDYTVFALEFTVSGVARPFGRARLAQVGLSGHAPALGRRDEFPPRDLFVSFTTDEAAIAAVDPEVLGYVQQKNLDRMVQDAVRQATVDAGRARQTLQVAVGMTQRLGNSAMTQMLENALDELNKTGTISVESRKTVALGGRTKTIKPGGTTPSEGGMSDADIRKLTGA
jgi:Ca-activated chloride channel family protein